MATTTFDRLGAVGARDSLLNRFPIGPRLRSWWAPAAKNGSFCASWRELAVSAEPHRMASTALRARSGGGCSDYALAVPVSGLVGLDCQVGGRGGGGQKVVG